SIQYRGDDARTVFVLCHGRFSYCVDIPSYREKAGCARLWGMRMNAMFTTRSIRSLVASVFIVLIAIYASRQGLLFTDQAIQKLVTWMPFILKGFWINLVMSALAMMLGTVLGVGLGLLELSHVAAVRKPAFFVM